MKVTRGLDLKNEEGTRELSERIAQAFKIGVEGMRPVSVGRAALHIKEPHRSNGIVFQNGRTRTHPVRLSILRESDVAS